MIDVADGEASDTSGMSGLFAQSIEHHRYGEGWHDGVLHLFVGFLAGDGLGQVAVELGFLLHALIALNPPQHGVETHSLALVRLQVLEYTEFYVFEVHRKYFLGPTDNNWSRRNKRNSRNVSFGECR